MQEALTFVLSYLPLVQIDMWSMGVTFFMVMHGTLLVGWLSFASRSGLWRALLKRVQIMYSRLSTL